MSVALRSALRDSLDRSTALGLFLRRVRRYYRRRAHAGSRVGNVAMLHAGRCGSSVVADLMKQHPDVYWRDEPFESMSPFYYRLDSARRAEELIANAMHSVATPYFGFDSKYLPEQHLRPELANKSVEDYVALLRRLGFGHFILVWRRNHLRRAVSVAVGAKTGQWNTMGKVERTTVRLDPRRFVSYRKELPLLEYFRSLDETHLRARAAIGSAGLLELEYESDIEHDPCVAYRKACAWLGIEAHAVTVRLRKLNDRPLDDIVENFNEIRSALTGTPYEWMLDDAVGRPAQGH